MCLSSAGKFVWGTLVSYGRILALERMMPSAYDETRRYVPTVPRDRSMHNSAACVT